MRPGDHAPFLETRGNSVRLGRSGCRLYSCDSVLSFVDIIIMHTYIYVANQITLNLGFSVFYINPDKRDSKRSHIQNTDSMNISHRDNATVCNDLYTATTQISICTQKSLQICQHFLHLSDFYPPFS